MADEVLQLPSSILNQIPAGPAPSGIESSLVDSQNRGYLLVCAASVFLALGLIAFSIRIYAKIFISRHLWWDDATLTLGLLGIITTYIGSVIGCTAGPCGRHEWDTSVGQEVTELSMISNYLDTAFLTPTLGFLKLSLFLMYYRLFWPLRWLRISVYVGSTVTCAFYAAITIYVFVYATPRPGVPWRAWVIRPDETKTLGVSIPTGTFGLATDTLLLLLPIPAVVTLQMPRKKKLGMLLLFRTGLLACVASAVGTYCRVVQYRTEDFNWNTVPIESLVQVEMNAGVLCVCMPAIAKVFKHHQTSIQSYTSRWTPRLPLLKSRKSHARLPESRDGVEAPSSSQIIELQRIKQHDKHDTHSSTHTANECNHTRTPTLDEPIHRYQSTAIEGTSYV